MAEPIWKDYFVNLGSADFETYAIACNGQIIYRGKAWKRPGEENILIRINDICADYLINVLPNLAPSGFTEMTTPEFEVYVGTGDTMSLKDTVSFINDWSYDYDYDPATMGLSFPVNGKVDIRQWIVLSVFNAKIITAKVTLNDGCSFEVFIPVEISDDFNEDFNKDFSQSVRGASTGTAVFNLSQFENIKSVEIDGKALNIVESCSQYAFYYVNAYGGWDSLLIEGNHSEMDTLTRHMREVEYDNRSIQNRGKINYVNEIVKSMILHTSWLSDDESSRMHHLLNSTCVYLGDINTGAMIPVVLTDTQTDYKTYKGNGGKLVSYAINVTIAQERVRR